MSDELRDEVEAINSIYGDGCLTPADDGAPGSYILQLPGDEASSLRLRFPESYPSMPPETLATHHSSGGKKGAGARDLALFKEVVHAVFQEGLVCLFDAMEEYSRKREEEEEAEEKNESSGLSEQEKHKDPVLQRSYPSPDLETLPPPPWTLSEPVTEQKSTFIAHVAPVSSPAQARQYVAQLLASDKRIRAATHNITAWRIRGPMNGGGATTTTSYQDCDDDGEDAAGGRLLHLMQLMDLWDAMVVVTRWYGGVLLGPKRFALINAAARDGFVRAGMVHEDKKEKKKGK